MFYCATFQNNINLPFVNFQFLLEWRTIILTFTRSANVDFFSPPFLVDVCCHFLVQNNLPKMATFKKFFLVLSWPTVSRIILTNLFGFSPPTFGFRIFCFCSSSSEQWGIRTYNLDVEVQVESWHSVRKMVHTLPGAKKGQV